MRMLDLFCGRFGWGRIFAKKGWEVVGVDLVEPPEIPKGCEFLNADILGLMFTPNVGFEFYQDDYRHFGGTYFDFICASPPCEQFSVHGMKHFHPNPKYPELGIKLFNHTREICEASGVPYVIENVRSAQQFVGNAVHHCGPFYLWGSGVPPIMPQGISKVKQFRAFPSNKRTEALNAGLDLKTERNKYQQKREREALDRDAPGGYRSSWSGSEARKLATAQAAQIPPELASCVADYAERLIEQKNNCKEPKI